jgi:hypothetical protein
VSSSEIQRQGREGGGGGAVGWTRVLELSVVLDLVHAVLERNPHEQANEWPKQGRRVVCRAFVCRRKRSTAPHL